MLTCSDYVIVLVVPIIFGMLLFAHTTSTWKRAARADRRESSTLNDEIKYHNEAIYKNIDFFLKVTTAIFIGIGFAKSKQIDAIVGGKDVARAEHVYAMLIVFLALIYLISASFYVFTISCHQASKIMRWKEVRMNEKWTWLEPWTMIAMFIVGTFVWCISFYIAFML